MTTGRLAIGALRSRLQNWLLSAVKSSGAVSPLMRATASSTPVIDAGARGPIGHARDHVRARHAERGGGLAQRGSGTSSSMSSVVRTTTGMTITASATAPAQRREMAHAARP